MRPRSAKRAPADEAELLMKLIQLLVKYKTENSYSKQTHAHAAALAQWGAVMDIPAEDEAEN